MRALCIAILTALVASCSSTPTEEQAPAGVEDRKPAAGSPGAGGPDTKGAVRSQPGQVDITGGGAKPGASILTDPSSPLSKRSIFYDFDKFDIRDEFKPLIEAHARYLRDNPSARMLVQGNSDERGGREYNLALGQRRSDSVKKMLLLLGARESQVEAVSLGEEKPRAPGSSEEAYSQNRRSDILYGGEF